MQTARSNLKRALVSGAALLAISSAGPLSAAITGSAHDFSTETWVSGNQICVACHTPHGANTGETNAPLWNHALTTQTYTLYTSPTLNAVAGQPSGASRLCLSCHDGTVALNNYGGGVVGAPQFMSGTEAVGAAAQGSLSNDHPISITYNTALATTDGGLYDPSTRNVTVGSGTNVRTGTIQNLLLFANQVQCASCHDVHNSQTAQTANLLRISATGSAICLACHNK